MPLTQKLIESKTLTSTTNLVNFTSIPSTYDHLLLRVSVRTNRNNDGYADVSIVINNTISTNIYRNLYFNAAGNGTASSSGVGSGTVQGGPLYSSVVTSISNYENYFGNAYILIPNYKIGNVKIGRWESYAPTWASGSNGIVRNGILSADIAEAITTISFRDENSATLQVGSTLDLYGLVNS